MNSPKWILCITTLLLAVGVKAQDKIHKADGEIINAKVKSVGTSTITYVRFENQDGPEYTVDKEDVSEIVYENGSKDVFENSDRRYPRPPHPPMRPMPFDRIKKSDIKYGKNVFAIAPLQFTENGIGTSLTYERTIDRTGFISFYLPVVLTYNVNNQVNNGYGSNNPAPMFYVMPGIKFYPTTNQGHVKYAIGPSLVWGTGRVTNDTYYTGPNGNIISQGSDTRDVFGIILNNSLNVNPTPHLFIGAELGMGATYFNRINGEDQDIRFLIQTAFRMGYRF